MKSTIINILENTDSKHEKLFAISIQLLIVISIISFSISTLPNLSHQSKKILDAIEIFTVTIFTIEYILRIYIAKHKTKFIFSFHGFIDLLAVLPFYIATSLDLRSIRVFRLLRLFQILKLLRYSKAINRLYRAFLIAKEELILFSFVSLILLYLAAVGIYYFEHEAQPNQFQSIFHSLWWAVTTLTTVGYGDIYPITLGGRLFTFFVLMIGLGVVAVPTGLVASALSTARNSDES